MLYISKYFTFNYVYSDVYVYVRAKRPEALDAPGVTGSLWEPDTWVLGIEFESSGRAAGTVN